MSKLAKDKRDKLILVGTITAMIIASLWFLIIGGQRETLDDIAKKQKTLADSISKAEGTIKTEPEIQKRLGERLEALHDREEEMAPEDDPYAWMLDVMNRFCQGRQVGWTLVTPQIKQADLIPGFTYKTAVFHFKGTGMFHAVGKFIADFENTHRLFQIRNVQMVPAGGAVTARASGGTTEDESLAVEFDIVTPIRPNEAQSSIK